jgi:hypothetical protein
MINWMLCVMAALVTFRIARMLTIEDGPFGVFCRVRAALGKKAAVSPRYGLAWAIAELFNCPHCMGMWVALFVSPLVVFPTVVGNVFLIVLSIAGLQSFLQGRSPE